MRTWAIGDLQGCDEALQRLLAEIGFRPSQDRLIFCGDLVNRGPESLAVLRRVKALGDSADSVLGNHDLHCLAVAHGKSLPKRKDTLDAVLGAPDSGELLGWLLQRPLLLQEPGYLVAHAGIPPSWNLETAQQAARACEGAMRADPARFFSQMYGNEPAGWEQAHSEVDRHRYTINGFTRMRYCRKDGSLDFDSKLGPEQSTLTPWFALPSRHALAETVIFGHWSTLGEVQWPAYRVIGLDTGCVWGGPLTAYCLETGELRSVPGLAEAVPVD